ncbi:MAG TPA: hypothetical protein VLA20_05610, partial [Vicinamibacterales bacterium]|nr:hypothetical protein [Vicinamibacterales bacterium]
RGEFTVVIPNQGVAKESIDSEGVYRLFARLVEGEALSESEAADLVSKAHGVTPSVVLKLVKKLKISIKQPKRQSG